MEDAASVNSRRSITSVDLGELRAGVAAASAAAGVGPSTWLRDLVRRELSGAQNAAAPAPMPAEETSGVYRAWLDADATAKLDRITQAGGFRSRAAALRGLLDGVNVNVGARGTVGIAEAVQALGLSNHQLVAVSRQMSELAKTATSGNPKQPTAADRPALNQSLQSIRAHLDLAAVLVGKLRPMLKSKKDER